MFSGFSLKISIQKNTPTPKKMAIRKCLYVHDQAVANQHMNFFDQTRTIHVFLPKINAREII